MIGGNAATLGEVLARETRDGELYDVLPDGRLRCDACGHQCPLPGTNQDRIAASAVEGDSEDADDSFGMTMGG